MLLTNTNLQEISGKLYKIMYNKYKGTEVYLKPRWQCKSMGLASSYTQSMLIGINEESVSKVIYLSSYTVLKGFYPMEDNTHHLIHYNFNNGLNNYDSVSYLKPCNKSTMIIIRKELRVRELDDYLFILFLIHMIIFILN
jgi:hypothetical protein